MRFPYLKILASIYFSTALVNTWDILRFFLVINILIKGNQCHYSCENYCKCSGSFVDCSNQQLSKLSPDFPAWIESLRLNKNAFAEVPLFPLMSNLTYLNLAHNKITFINRESFENVPNLKTLELNNNIISELSLNAFINSSYLEILNLNSNNISKIEPNTFNGLKRLKELRLNRNKLYQIYKDIFKPITSLQTLELNRNQISNISGLTFKELEHLGVLRLRQNIIDDLADGAFYGLYNLKELCLDYNRLTRVSKGWLYGLELLSHLNVSYNKIQYLNSGWESCPHLTELDLSYNEIQSIEKGIFEHLLKLQSLRLDHNQITYIQEGSFDFIPSLQYLDLSSNHIAWIVENIGSYFASLKKLNHLLLATNGISLVIENAFAGLENLVYLNLDDNEITEIKENPFSVSSHLQTLIINSNSFICDCSLVWLPNWLKSVTALHTTKLDRLRCMHPASLKGKAINKIADPEFVCSNEDHPQPFITVDPEDVVALVGNNVTLRCGANSTSDSDMEFTWKRNNYRVKNASFRRYASAQTYGVTQFSDLQLIGITMASNGYYQCSVANSFGVAYSRSSLISVLVFPSFVKVPVNVEEKVGNTAKLECVATGYPAPRISWQKDGGTEFPAAQERRMKIEDAFFIVNLKLVDVGVYTCTARNTAGVITANATLTALESPSFSKKIEDKQVIIGEATVIECMGSGSPKLKINWLKEDKPLQISKRHFLTADDQLLIIMNTTIEDTGSYECVLSNSLGTARGVSHLIVLPLSKSDFQYKEVVIVIALTIVICALGTSFIWIVIIWRGHRRNTNLATPLSPIDVKSENSSHSSKDSGTGDSTKRSYQDLLLTAGTNSNSIEVIHEERPDSPITVPEVTLPLLTTFHPKDSFSAAATANVTSKSASLSSSSSSSRIALQQQQQQPLLQQSSSFVTSSIASGIAVNNINNNHHHHHHNSNNNNSVVTMSHIVRADQQQSEAAAVPSTVVTTAVLCSSSPASSNEVVQCTCLMATFKKKSDLCECLTVNVGSPIKHRTTGYYTIANNHCNGGNGSSGIISSNNNSNNNTTTGIVNHHQHHENRCYPGDNGKRPCSIPIPCHHVSAAAAAHQSSNNCCRHPNSYLCLYMPHQQHNM